MLGHISAVPQTQYLSYSSNVSQKTQTNKKNSEKQHNTIAIYGSLKTILSNKVQMLIHVIFLIKQNTQLLLSSEKGSEQVKSTKEAVRTDLGSTMTERKKDN